MCTDWGTSSCNMVSEIMFYGVVPIMWLVTSGKFDKIAANSLRKTEDTTTMQILAYFASLFYHFNEFQKFKNDIVGFHTT